MGRDPKLGREINFDGSQGHRNINMLSVSQCISVTKLNYYSLTTNYFCYVCSSSPHLPPPGHHVMVSLTGMTPVSNAYVGLAVGPCRLVYITINHCTFSFSLLYSGSRRNEMFQIGSLMKTFENHWSIAINIRLEIKALIMMPSYQKLWRLNALSHAQLIFFW